MFKVLFTLLFALPSVTLAADFRQANWGDTPQQVKATEEAKMLFEDGNMIAYSTTLANIDMLVAYTFLGGKLIQAGYMSQEKYINSTKHIDDFKKLKSLLTKKYGAPDKDKTTWRNDLYRDNPQEWGTAVSIGHLVFGTEWNTDSSVIRAGITGENFEVKMGVFYRDRANQDKIESNNEEKALDQL